MTPRENLEALRKLETTDAEMVVLVLAEIYEALVCLRESGGASSQIADAIKNSAGDIITAIEFKQ